MKPSTLPSAGDVLRLGRIPVKPGYFPVQKFRELVQNYVSDEVLRDTLLSNTEKAVGIGVVDQNPAVEDFDKQALINLSSEQVQSLFALKKAMAQVPDSERVLPQNILGMMHMPAAGPSQSYVESQSQSPDLAEAVAEREAKEKAEREAEEKRKAEQEAKAQEELEKSGQVVWLNGMQFSVSQETLIQITDISKGLETLSDIVDAIQCLINGDWYDRMPIPPVPFAVKLDKESADKVGNLCAVLIPKLWTIIAGIFAKALSLKVAVILSLIVSTLGVYGGWILHTNKEHGTGVRLEYYAIIGVVLVFAGNYE